MKTKHILAAALVVAVIGAAEWALFSYVVDVEHRLTRLETLWEMKRGK